MIVRSKLQCISCQELSAYRGVYGGGPVASRLEEGKLKDFLKK